MIFYERIPLVSDEKTAGYLIYVDRDLNESAGSEILGIDMNSMSLKEMITSFERTILVESLNQNNNDTGKTAQKLKISSDALNHLLSDHSIKINSPRTTKSKKK